MRGKFPTIYMPKEYMDWKALVAEYVKSHYAETIPSDLIELPVAVTHEHIVQPPKTTKLSHPKPDLDNYDKSVLDALTSAECVWKDDTQVWSLTSQKRWAREGDAVGIHVTLTYG